MKMQYAGQKQSYRSSFPDAEQLIIELAGEKIGQLWIKHYEEKIHLIDISVLRDFRGKGIGSYMLNKLKSETETIILRVQNTNFGAIELYRRHGFIIVSNTGTYLEMEWKNAG
jgi:ribosomal protein S18 acetylase RimI-like enzyme